MWGTSDINNKIVVWKKCLSFDSNEKRNNKTSATPSFSNDVAIEDIFWENFDLNIKERHLSTTNLVETSYIELSKRNKSCSRNKNVNFFKNRKKREKKCQLQKSDYIVEMWHVKKQEEGRNEQHIHVKGRRKLHIKAKRGTLDAIFLISFKFSR